MKGIHHCNEYFAQRLIGTQQAAGIALAAILQYEMPYRYVKQDGYSIKRKNNMIGYLLIETIRQHFFAKNAQKVLKKAQLSVNEYSKTLQC